MASAPTTPSSARRGIHSWMRRGNSCNTSRQSPISVRAHRAVGILARAADEMNGRSEPAADGLALKRDPPAQCRSATNRSTIHPASIMA